MDQDIDGRQTKGSAVRAASQDPETGGTSGAAERKKAYFSVRLTFSGTSQEFEDPRLAGEAFFRADPAERPSVTHVDGNTARTMARTELHGTHEGGVTRYFKSLPDSHAPDAEFRAGFLSAMEASITERLEKVTNGRDGANVVERLDAGLKDDLEAFARREPEKAASLWSVRMEESAPGPILQAAVKAREGVVEAEAQIGQVVTSEKAQVVATGDWVDTDRDVELRPVAMRTGRGVHAGFEARSPEGEAEISFSDRTLATSREALRHALLAQAGWQAASEDLFMARTRHVQALQRTQAHLEQAQAQAALRDAALDLLAEELRLAHHALCEITGEFGSEDLLGEIFGRFCIGK